jgi:hypothetical protein
MKRIRLKTIRKKHLKILTNLIVIIDYEWTLVIIITFKY